MKGIVLAGGAGSRLDPITRVAGKQLQPVYDKPMVYYPLATLMEAGIREILLISTPDDTPRFEGLLGNGSSWGVSISYVVQQAPRGIAEALVLGEGFLGGEPCALILGDNIFHGAFGLEPLVAGFSEGAVIFAYPVGEPSRYGVVEIGPDGTPLSLEEKPATPRSHLAVPGLYLYDHRAPSIARELVPSDRGELEITDVNQAYLDLGLLRVVTMGRGTAWLDSGTHDSLLEASNFIATIERRQGLKIACLEEIAYRRGYVDRGHLSRLVAGLPGGAYREYLESVMAEDAGTP